MRAGVRIAPLLLVSAAVSAQVPAQLPAPLTATELPKGISRVAGTDADSGIRFALISLEGRLASAGAPLPAKGPPPPLPQQPKPAPRLTAQCTRAGDKMKYELLFDMGGLPEVVFIPPWRPQAGALFEPPIKRMMATMDFLGYVKVKPARRQFDLLEGPMTGVMRYSTPGLNTSNLDPIAFYMQYLKALPTLRLTVPGRGVVEFETLPWQAIVRAEPLCYMSSL